MTLTYSAVSRADATLAWDLIARPAQWSRWAPHLRGARGLGSPEVAAGRSGLAIVVPVLLVPARITDKQPGRSWTWRVGPVTMRHRVEPTADGCVVAVDLQAPRAIEALLAASYGPLTALLVRNLARVAESDRDGPPPGGR